MQLNITLNIDYSNLVQKWKKFEQHFENSDIATRLNKEQVLLAAVGEEMICEFFFFFYDFLVRLFSFIIENDHEPLALKLKHFEELILCIQHFRMKMMCLSSCCGRG